MNAEALVNSEPLPGYHLVERLGSGGYGEVWRARAPGGLEKAIKFVFGSEHEKRATRERSSLHKIRELRHPFLLSLERIEVVDGRLLVVTELADGSVKDRFDECREQELPGIPRDELLGYMRDAADALDFMGQSHSLQHLDIKPENLLLVAEHVKVADFGLVKDVQQSQASIVGGMTPLYSAPEVFRGQPSSRSDQYSLAILYQEMLTGTLPFAGATAAELTLQHLNDEPNLAMLQGGDRFVISRALSKDADHRYACCRDFVGALMAAETSDKPASANSAAAREAIPSTDEQSRATHVFDDDTSVVSNEPMLVDFSCGETAEVRRADAADIAAGEFEPCSTLLLGIGGTGGHVLNHLRRQLGERFGGIDRIPAVRMLVMDSDPKSLSELTHATTHSFTAEETVALPIRRPQHYRDNAARLLKWLSRRWLYNIPKSMRTEGLRPLGRLAFVDHARQACQRIRQALALATEADNRAKTSEAFAKPLAENKCRVYVVASISGGTGGGMVVDAAYAARAALEKLQINEAEIIGILVHSTGRDQRVSELARVNAYASLNELQHFMRADVAYPGDQSCGLPAHDPATPPLDHTYLVHLGDGVPDSEFDQAASAIAEYLQLDIGTPAHSFFDQCRRSNQHRPERHLRSFGMHRISGSPAGLAEAFAGVLCEQTLTRWANHDSQDDGQQVVSDNADFVKKLKLSCSGLAAVVRSAISAALNESEADFVRRQLGRQVPPGSTAPDGNVYPLVDKLFRRADDGDESTVSFKIGEHTLADKLRPLEETLRNDVVAWLLHRLDVPNGRLAGTRRAAESLVTHLESVQNDAKNYADEIKARIVELREGSSNNADQNCPKLAAQPVDWLSTATEYFVIRLDHCALIAVQHLCRLITADAKETLDRLTMLGRDFQQMASVSQGATPARATLEAGADPWQGKALEHLYDQLASLCARLDTQIQTDYLDANGGLMKAVTGGGRGRAQLLATMRQIAQGIVHSALKDVSIMDTVGSGASGHDMVENLLAATPKLLDHGGLSRALAILPEGSDDRPVVSQISESFGAAVAATSTGDNCFSICVEAEQLPLGNVAMTLIQRRRDYLDFADRVRSRSDVRWTKISEMPGGESAAASDPVAQGASDAVHESRNVTQLLT